MPCLAAFRFVPITVEMCKYMRNAAVQFLSCLRNIPAESAEHSQMFICALGDAAAVGDGVEGENGDLPPD